MSKNKLKFTTEAKKDEFSDKLIELNDLLVSANRRISILNEVVSVFLPKYFGESYQQKLKAHLSTNYELTGKVSVTKYNTLEH